MEFQKKQSYKQILGQNTFIHLGLTEREQPVRHFFFGFLLVFDKWLYAKYVLGYP